MYHATRLMKLLPLVTLMVLTAGLTIAQADVVQTTVELPPPAGAYVFSGFECLSSISRCLNQAVISDFTNPVSNQVGGNEQVSVDAVYTAGVYTESSGMPDMLLGTLTMTGSVDFLYTGRNPMLNPLGPFPTQVTSFDLSGTFNGMSFEVIQNPSIPSTGTTTINQTTFTPPIEYTVSSTLAINGEFNFNGMGFVPAPPRTTTLTGVPEPGYTALTGFLLISFVAMASRHRKNSVNR